jgi:hypothetical protein
MFGIAKTTLQRAVKEDAIPRRSGPSTVLTEKEERELTGYCLNMQQLGFGLSKAAVNVKVMEILQATDRINPFTAKGEPSRHWWSRFMQDHSELSFRVPQALKAARAQRANPVIISLNLKRF